jgi:hypothetical protein
MTITFGLNNSAIIFHGQRMLRNKGHQLMYLHLIILNMEFACSLF